MTISFDPFIKFATGLPWKAPDQRVFEMRPTWALRNLRIKQTLQPSVRFYFLQDTACALTTQLKAPHLQFQRLIWKLGSRWDLRLDSYLSLRLPRIAKSEGAEQTQGSGGFWRTLWFSAKPAFMKTPPLIVPTNAMQSKITFHFMSFSLLVI